MSSFTKYSGVFVSGAIASAVAFYFFGNKISEVITDKKIEKIEDKKTESTTITKETAKKKTIYTKPKIIKGEIVDAESAVVFDEPTKTVDNNRKTVQNTDTKSSEYTKTTYEKTKYSVGISTKVYSFKGQQGYTPSFANSSIDVGMRVIGPLWATTSYDINAQGLSIGARVEF